MEESEQFFTTQFPFFLAATQSYSSELSGWSVSQLCQAYASPLSQAKVPSVLWREHSNLI